MVRLLLMFTFAMSSLAYANERANACTSIKDDKSRLACYDYLFKIKVPERDHINKAQARPENRGSNYQRNTQKEKKPPEIKKEETEVANSNSLFGLTKRQINEVKKVKEDNSINSVIKKVKKSLTGKLIVTLNNSQVWESQPSLPLSKTTHFVLGNKIKIEKRRSGGFWLIDVRTGIKVKAKRVK